MCVFLRHSRITSLRNLVTCMLSLFFSQLSISVCVFKRGLFQFLEDSALQNHNIFASNSKLSLINLAGAFSLHLRGSQILGPNPKISKTFTQQIPMKICTSFIQERDGGYRQVVNPMVNGRCKFERSICFLLLDPGLFSLDLHLNSLQVRKL